MTRLPLLLAIAFAFLAACTSAERGENRLVVAVESPPETLDRRMALGATAMRVAHLVTPGLTRIDAAGRAVPDLAASFTADDPRSWRFVLREGLLFSDGTPLTAADVVATWRSVLDPATGSPHRGGYGYLEAVEAPDPRTVIFRLAAPFGAFPVDASLGILPSRLVAPEHREALRARPIGAGPYVVEKWERDEQLLLAPNPRYHGGAPALPLEIRTVRDETTRVLELRKGRVDVLLNAVSAALLPALREEQHLSVTVGPGAGVSYLMFNLEDPLLGRREVREAIALALDREAIARYKFKGAARIADTFLRPEHWAYEDETAKWPHDPARAKALLDAAGYTDPDGDGPGTRFRLSFKTSTDRFRRSVALVMAAQLAAVGIGVDVAPLEWGTFMGDVKRGNFQLATLKVTPVIDPDLFRLISHSASIPSEETAWGGMNRMRYRNAAVDALLTQGREATDPEARRAAYAQVQRVLARDLPTLPLVHEDAVGVVATDLEGVVVDPQGSLHSLAAARRVE
ncbi:ABC transporter substrate-binding protein [Vulgatibacter sp.]|uniref:ABC transporter substrate-binding protein n=1 Tax=Vulgatibacter sp. TaxID=1971226 RepID=UPI00356A7E36